MFVRGEQRKINYNGLDTFGSHSAMDNAFQKQATQTFQMIGGEIIGTQPEPLFANNAVIVQPSTGGTITNVAYPGAFVDPASGNMHGTYEGPIPGQMVMMGFDNGNAKSPFVVNKYPYQGVGNSLTEQAYLNPLTKASFDSTDIITGHFSGAYLSFNTGVLSGKLPGSVTLNSIAKFESICALGSTIEQDIDISLSNGSGYKIEMTATGIVLQDATGQNKIEIGPSGVIFTVAGQTFGAATHIHPTGVGPSGSPTPGT